MRPLGGSGLARHRVPVVAAFVACSGLVAAAAGLPDRAYLVMWVVALAALVTWQNPHRWAQVTFDWLPVLVIAAGYDLVRSFAPDLIPRAVVKPQLEFDEAIFGGRTPTVWLQDALVDHGTPHWWDYIAWLFYLSHFVVTPGIACWLYQRHRDWFRRYRALLLTVSLVGFATYFVVPAVPPWMASRSGALPHTIRIVHAVWDHLGVSSVAQVFSGDAKLANPVGALPSLHAAWPFMSLLFLWNRVPRGRWLLIAYNAAMVTVLVYGAEHYVSDILLGWVYATVVFVVLERVTGPARRRGHARSAAPSSRPRTPPPLAPGTRSASIPRPG